MINNLFLRLVCLTMTLVLLPFAGQSKGEPYDVKEPDACALNFSVLSDCHMEGNKFIRYQMLNQAFQDVERNQSGHDAILFLGDSTMNGQHIENMLFHGLAALRLRNENVLPAAGNHDTGNGEGDFEKIEKRWYTYIEAFFGKKLEHPYYCEVIDGFYFIALGAETQTVYQMTMSDAQFEFLAHSLAKAAESGKPAFVFMHFPVHCQTDLDGNYTGQLKAMLAEYSRAHDLFVLVGHYHQPMSLGRTFQNGGGFPEIYLPCMSQLTDTEPYQPHEDGGVGLDVEVYQNEVVLRGRDYYRSEWKTDPASGALCEVAYQLKNPIAA